MRVNGLTARPDGMQKQNGRNTKSRLMKRREEGKEEEEEGSEKV